MSKDSFERRNFEGVFKDVELSMSRIRRIPVAMQRSSRYLQLIAAGSIGSKPSVCHVPVTLQHEPSCTPLSKWKLLA